MMKKKYDFEAEEKRLAEIDAKNFVDSIRNSRSQRVPMRAGNPYENYDAYVVYEETIQNMRFR